MELDWKWNNCKVNGHPSGLPALAAMPQRWSHTLHFEIPFSSYIKSLLVNLFSPSGQQACGVWGLLVYAVRKVNCGGRYCLVRLCSGGSGVCVKVILRKLLVSSIFFYFLFSLTPLFSEWPPGLFHTKFCRTQFLLVSTSYQFHLIRKRPDSCQCHFEVYPRKKHFVLLPLSLIDFPWLLLAEISASDF